MKAAVCRSFTAPLGIEDIRLTPPAEGEIRVKLAACAICHSDIMAANGAWGGVLPAVYGHEAAGIVEEVGEGLRDIEKGDHVVVTLVRSCGHCFHCVNGDQIVCETSFPLDRNTPLRTTRDEPISHGLRTGAFAEEVVVNRSQAVVIPKDVPFESASLLACGVITGFGAVTNTAKMPAGANTVIVGTGGVGLNSIQGAAISGAARIIAVDISDSKLNAAKIFGATHTLNATTENLGTAVKEITHGRGADYVFVTVGSKSAFNQAPDLLAPSGAVVLVGMAATGTKSEYDPVSLAHNNQRIIGSKMGSARIARDIPMLVDLYKQGRLKLDELITNRYPLEQINEAMADVVAGKALRNVIIFQEGTAGT